MRSPTGGARLIEATAHYLAVTSPGTLTAHNPGRTVACSPSQATVTRITPCDDCENMPNLRYLRPLRAFAATLILAACDTPLTQAPGAPARDGIPTAPGSDLVTAVGPTLRLTASAETLRVKPRLPYWMAITARVESAGILLSDSAAVTLSDPAAAKVWFAPVKRRTKTPRTGQTRP